MKAAIKKLLVFSLIFGISLFVVVSLVRAGYGEAGVASTCTAEKPEKPWLYYTESLGGGKVKLVWDKNARVSTWTVAYGTEAGKYIWGWNNFGYSEMRSVVINELPDGTYYFVVRANNGCMPGPFSNEQMVRVGRARTVQQLGTPPTVTYEEPTTTPGVGKPKATPTPKSSYVPPAKEGAKVTPKLTPVPLQPMPIPAPKVGFFQRIVNFFTNLFK